MEQEKNATASSGNDLSDVDGVLVVFEEGEDKPYKLADTTLSFDIKIDDDGSIKFKSGEIKTSYFIQNNELTFVETWRYQVRGVHMHSMHFDTTDDMITYKFTAKDFTDKTLLEDDDEYEDE